jgi:hypothetical protein
MRTSQLITCFKSHEPIDLLPTNKLDGTIMFISIQHITKSILDHNYIFAFQHSNNYN